jgi:CBS domain-containing protein
MLTASDVMTTNVITVTPETSVKDTARLLYTERISGVPVMDIDGQVIGIVSENDLIRHVEVTGEPRRSWLATLLTDDSTLAREYAKTHGRTVQDVMTTPVITVAETTSLAQIAETLERHSIKRLPVVREGLLIGIVTRNNLLQALATTDVSEPTRVDDREIRDRVSTDLAKQPWTHMTSKNIVVNNGIVHLFGFVQTEEERNALRIAAAGVPGVVTVEDHLTLRSELAPI